MTEIIFDENENWEKRILCSDESCIGVIGPDGKCKECGKVYEGVFPEEHGQEKANTENVDEVKDVPSEETVSDDEWNKRVLCSDGACIGVIGPDGRCKECGKPL